MCSSVAYPTNVQRFLHVKVLEEFAWVHWVKQSLHDWTFVHNYVFGKFAKWGAGKFRIRNLKMKT